MMIGFRQMAQLYIASGVGGILFSSMVSNSNSVGASTADFGIYTGFLAMIFVNWNAFSARPELEQMRCMFLFFVVLIIIINLLTSSGRHSTVDVYGHIGGAITGLLWGFAFFPRVKSGSGESLKKFGLIATPVYFVLFLMLFYTAKKVY